MALNTTMLSGLATTPAAPAAPAKVNLNFGTPVTVTAATSQAMWPSIALNLTGTIFDQADPQLAALIAGWQATGVTQSQVTAAQQAAGAGGAALPGMLSMAGIPVIPDSAAGSALGAYGDDGTSGVTTLPVDTITGTVPASTSTSGTITTLLLAALGVAAAAAAAFLFKPKKLAT